jgi:hypothetical protein
MLTQYEIEINNILAADGLRMAWEQDYDAGLAWPYHMQFQGCGWSFYVTKL